LIFYQRFTKPAAFLSKGDVSVMQVPLQMSFRRVRKSTAIEDLIRDQAAKLERVCDHIVGCRIAVEKPQKHQKSGNPFRVRIDVTVPPEHELVVTREASEGDLHEQLPTVLRNAFGAMRRQLRKLVEKQHGDIKTHPAQEVGGLVVRLFREQGYGFIKSPDGEEIYFHKNSLPGDEFERLEIGTGVQWHQEEGNNGPQASTVRIIDKPS
jgi:cold shock CspA family protein/ribosome-associated translation inhibitor RaiA